MPSPVWRVRWQSLKDAGLTRKQAEAVYLLIESCGGHKYAWVAEKSWEELEAVFPGRRGTK